MAEEAERIASWNFQLFENGPFDVEVNVVNGGGAIVSLSVITPQRTKGKITGFEIVNDVVEKKLDKSGHGLLTVPFGADEDPDTVFSAYCGVFQQPGMGESWYWTLAIKQGENYCGLAPGQIPIESQSYGPGGVRDPKFPDAYTYALYDDSTIVFEVVAPPAKKGA